MGGYQRPASKTPFNRMLAWWFCDLSGDLDQYCLETLYFCDFQGGDPYPLPPSGSAPEIDARGQASTSNWMNSNRNRHSLPKLLPV